MVSTNRLVATSPEAGPIERPLTPAEQLEKQKSDKEIEDLIHKNGRGQASRRVNGGGNPWTYCHVCMLTRLPICTIL